MDLNFQFQGNIPTTVENDEEEKKMEEPRALVPRGLEDYTLMPELDARMEAFPSTSDLETDAEMDLVDASLPKRFSDLKIKEVMTPIQIEEINEEVDRQRIKQEANIIPKQEIQYASMTLPPQPPRFEVRQEILVDIFQQDEDGDTKLHVALIRGEPELVMRILSIRIPVNLINTPNYLRQTPLHLAVLTNSPYIVRKLVAVGALLDVRNMKGYTPVHLACLQNCFDCLRAMVTPLEPQETEVGIPKQDIRAIVDTKDYDGETAIHLAGARRYHEIVRYLISDHVGADVNERDGRSGRTVLHHAVEARDLELVRILLACPNLSIDATTFDGNTALGLAYGRRYFDLFQILSANGGHMLINDTLGVGQTNIDYKPFILKEEDMAL